MPCPPVHELSDHGRGLERCWIPGGLTERCPALSAPSLFSSPPQSPPLIHSCPFFFSFFQGKNKIKKKEKRTIIIITTFFLHTILRPLILGLLISSHPFSSLSLHLRPRPSHCFFCLFSVSFFFFLFFLPFILHQLILSFSQDRQFDGSASIRFSGTVFFSPAFPIFLSLSLSLYLPFHLHPIPRINLHHQRPIQPPTQPDSSQQWHPSHPGRSSNPRPQSESIPTSTPIPSPTLCRHGPSSLQMPVLPTKRPRSRPRCPPGLSYLA